jgi:hypothetical protein
MRRFAKVGLIALVSLLASGPASSGDAPGRLATSARAPSAIALRVHMPRGWHLIHRALTEVTDPRQALAVASFRVKLGHPCECGEPNVINLPRAGAFLFIWEYARGGANPKKIPSRPARFRITQIRPNHYACAGPSWLTGFRVGGHAFQVEVHFGPHAGPPTIARMEALLDSLKVVPVARPQP